MCQTHILHTIVLSSSEGGKGCPQCMRHGPCKQHALLLACLAYWHVSEQCQNRPQYAMICCLRTQLCGSRDTPMTAHTQRITCTCDAMHLTLIAMPIAPFISLPKQLPVRQKPCRPAHFQSMWKTYKENSVQSYTAWNDVQQQQIGASSLPAPPSWARCTESR